MIGALGQNSCQGSYGHIMSLSECNEARIELSIAEWHDDQYPTSTLRLPYCWIGPTDGANYNPNGDLGSDFSNSRLICKKGKFNIFWKKPKKSIIFQDLTGRIKMLSSLFSYVQLL